MRRSNVGTKRSSLMNAGRRVDYAVRALTYLAGQPPAKVISRAEIEKKQDIPSHYLSKIMKDLVASGLVHSHVGSKGGFSLARPAETISLKEVYETVERPIVIMECLEKGDEYCPYCSVCTQISVWDRAQSLLANYLASVTISNIADQTGLRERLISLAG
jgi:Rrf2 family protein